MTKKLFAASPSIVSSFTCNGAKIKTLGGTSVTVTSLVDGKYYFTNPLDTDGNLVIPFYPEQAIEFNGASRLIKSCTDSYFELTETVTDAIYPLDATSSKVVWTVASDLTYVRKSSLSINFEEFGISWGLGESYTVEYSEDFVSSVDGLDPSPVQSTSFDTPPTSVAFSSSVPANGSTGVLENVTLTLNFDRKISLGTGNITLYKVGSPDTLVYTIASTNTSRVSINDNKLILNITGQFQQGNTYYLLAPSGLVKDVWGFSSSAISSSSAVRFTMATSSEDPTGILKEVSNLTATRVYKVALTSSDTFIFKSNGAYSNTQPEFSFSVVGTPLNTTSPKFGNASLSPATTASRIIATPAAQSTSSTYSIQFWVKPKGSATSPSMAVFDSNNSSNSLGSLLQISATGVSPYTGYYITWNGINLPGSGTIDAVWTHWAIIKDGNIGKVYKDGVLQDTEFDASGWKDLVLQTTGVYIGGRYTGTAANAGCYIDDLRITKDAVLRYNSSTQAVADSAGHLLLLNFNTVSSAPSFTITKEINNTPPVITDLDIDNPTYSVTLTASAGTLYATNDTGTGGLTGSSITLTGTKSNLATRYNTAKITLSAGYGSNVNITYSQSKNGMVRETGTMVLNPRSS